MVDLLKILKHNDIKQAQLARAVGRHKQSVTNWISGLTTMHPMTEKDIINWLTDHNFKIFYK